MAFITPLVNYAADKLGLDRQLFVPMFETIEGVLSKNPAAVLSGVVGLTNQAVNQFGRLAKIEDVTKAASEAGIDLNKVKHGVVSWVADWFSRRFNHMGDVLKTRTARHASKIQPMHRVNDNMGAPTGRKMRLQAGRKKKA